jgi:hypothetical protein
MPLQTELDTGVTVTDAVAVAKPEVFVAVRV